MARATENNRLLKSTTPLGEDFLLINKMHVEEKLSELYEIDVEFLYDEEEDDDYFVTTVKDTDILGKTVSISIKQRNNVNRTMTGMVSNFTQGARNRRFTAYYATIVPHVWRLTQSFQSRIFQHKTVPDILKKVFEDYEVKYQLQKSYKPRNYCVQYRESDFAFASRLMEEEGISYYFEHAPETEKMVLRDDFKSPEDCPSKSEIPIYNEDLSSEIFEQAIKDWIIDFTLQSGKRVFWDNHFQLPNKKLEAEKLSIFNAGKNKEIEIYDYPGRYAKKYDESNGDLSEIFKDNQKTAENTTRSLDAQYRIISGISDCSTLTSGYRFQLKNHPNNDFNIQYVVLSVKHNVEQNPDYLVGDILPKPYENEFTCIPHGAGHPEFCPKTKTPKPVIYGSQTAFVVGPPGEEIYTDKYGRIKVQFHWDRDGKVNEDSSCWMRVAQSWAGNKWGAMFIPRIGMEVLVQFLEGDPDQPIVTGCVYQPEAMPPYPLPDEKTKSTIKSNSSPGGGGFNELRFEDKKGDEQIFIHGEKDLDVRIKHDRKEIIKNDSHLIVENDQFEKVEGDKHLIVNGNQNEKVNGSVSLKVGSNTEIKTGTKYAVDAGMEVHLKAGMKVVIEAGVQLSLKAAGGFVDIGPAGVTIQGTMVKINSGGAAGSGGGSSPDPPTDAKEAVNADSGKKVEKAKQPPPKKPTNYSQAAEALQNASQSGTPFVSA